MQHRDSRAISAFQKQVLSELGIVTWKLREAEEQEEQSSSTVESNTPARSAATSPQGLSGLDLIKQQMAKSSEAKAEPPKSDTPKNEVSKPEVSTPSAPKIAAQDKVPPVKTVLEFKAEVLIWQSPQLPISDLKISFEALEIPFQFVSTDAEPTHRYPLLISAQPAQHLVADESLLLTSASSKKQLWQALQAFKQFSDKAS